MHAIYYLGIQIHSSDIDCTLYMIRSRLVEPTAWEFVLIVRRSQRTGLKSRKISSSPKFKGIIRDLEMSDKTAGEGTVKCDLPVLQSTRTRFYVTVIYNS